MSREVTIPPEDPQCGAFLVGLFGSSAHPSNYHNFQFLSGTEEYCDPTIETCGTAAEGLPFEDYEEYNRFLGQISAFLALTPTFVFIYPTWLSRTDAEKTKTWDDHKFYLTVWGIFAGTHMFLYLPLLLLWLSLSGSPDPHAYWYSYWLDIIV